jgi:FMN-dependent oxidoreductase (nitrilotriacetate monooxygenase family)
MPKQIHLSGFTMFGPAPHMPLSWIYPPEKITHQWYEPQYWESIAQTLELGGFDMLFLADTLHGGTTPDQIRYAIQFPCHDPVALVTYLSATVKKLAFAVTMSTTFSPVFTLARSLATLDHLTQGRIGWNIVASFATGEALNFGLDELPAHDERYDRADEYLEACYALWNSWEDDAMVMDMEQRIFAHPAKVHTVDFVGRWYKTKGPFTVVPSPSGRPFLFQAGQSDRGKTFAARHADGIFSVARGRGQMRDYCEDIASRAERNGRDPASIPILWAAAPLVAPSEAQARERYDEIRARIPLEASLAQMSAHWDVDLSLHDLDSPVSDLDVPGIKGLFEIYSKSDPQITLREIAKTYLSGGDKNPFVGTPEQVADAMQHFLEEGGGNGFQITPSYYAPDYFANLVNLLVPVLKKRGAYPKEYRGKTLREYLSPSE